MLFSHISFVSGIKLTIGCGATSNSTTIGAIDAEQEPEVLVIAVNVYEYLPGAQVEGIGNLIVPSPFPTNEAGIKPGL